MKKLKIAFISQPEGKVIPPVESGSIGIWIYQVAFRLAPHFEVLVYAPQGPPLKSRDIIHQGVIYRYPARLSNRLWNKLAHLLIPDRVKRFFSPLYHLGFILKVARNLKKEQVDIVHLHNYSQYLPLLRFFNPRLKIILHMHCEWLTQLDEKIITRRLSCCDLVVGCSDYIKEKIAAKLPQYEGICRAIFNGVDVATIAEAAEKQTKEEEPTLLFVGRISPEKGLHILMAAFNLVVKKYPKARLCIVGGVGVVPRELIVDISDDLLVRQLGVFYEKPEGYFQQLKGLLSPEAEKRVTFTGRKDHSQLLAYYASSHILVNPSLSESFGMSLIEGMSAGLPVVATRVGGMVNVVLQEKTGILVAPDDPESLAGVLCGLLAHPKRAREMGAEGLARVKALFDWEIIAAACKKEYEELKQ